MIFSVNRTQYQREKVLSYLKANRYGKVLDVGGALGPWAGEYVTYYCDLQDVHMQTCHENHKLEQVMKSTSIVGNIESSKIQNRLVKEGPFDFIICTQCLEHLGSPQLLLDFLPKIGRSGFIGLPNGVTELTRGVYAEGDQLSKWNLVQYTRGFAPHRWIFDIIKEEELYFFPKYTILDSMKLSIDLFSKNLLKKYFDAELGFWWIDNIKYTYYDDSYFDFSEGLKVCQALDEVCNKVADNVE
jgi:hypothetical protein